jgi:hypothetical protein
MCLFETHELQKLVKTANDSHDNIRPVSIGDEAGQ